MIDFEKELNDRQIEAVRHFKGPLLVIAGAGSGKTRVITYRVANLVENHGVNPARILAVTFTNKAANEMKERIDRLLGRRASGCWVATFHATCARLLRTYGLRAGINPKFTIYDDSDQKAMIARCLKELSFDKKMIPPELVQSEINRSKREMIGPDEYQGFGFLRDTIKASYAFYEQRMREASALDFADLLFRAVLGMRQDKDLEREIAGLFDFVLVDEFQDTNMVQIELVRLLAKSHRNVCVVGDDDQSIYSWRGADVNNILHFDRIFPGTEAITLDRNYRSTTNILKAAHGVVEKLSQRRPKKLWTTSENGDQIGSIDAEDERDEARLVCRAIMDLREDGYALGSQAVFYRVNAQSRVFEEVFRAAGIPYQVVGGMRFYERAEVKDMLAYLRLVQNPDDVAAFVRAVNTPKRGIGKSTVDKLVSYSAKQKVSAYRAIETSGQEIGASQRKKLIEFFDSIEELRSEVENGPFYLAGRVLEVTGYLQRLQAEDTAEADSRIENLKELVGSIQQFEREAEEPTLENYLALISLQTDIDSADLKGEQTTLMTVHSSKGLEFDVVFVTGLEERLFPYRPANRAFLIDEKEMEEERRLCYVAMTRAKRRLFLTSARSRRIFGQDRFNPPSRFLSDVPEELIVDLTPQPVETEVERVGTVELVGGSETWIDRSFDQSAEATDLEPGDKVRHALYGVGKVVEIRYGARIEVAVEFPAFGKKLLPPSKLDPI